MGGIILCNDSIRSIKEYQRKAESAYTWPQPAQVNVIEGVNHPIIFSDADTWGLDLPHNDPLVITLTIGDCNVRKVLVDIDSSVDLIYKETLVKMGVSILHIKPFERRLTAFDNRSIKEAGTIKLPIQAGSVTKRS
ncbi:hypothetical protein V5N11_033128 [Cardamine amara subsp. amara]|uniref:Uncharacterized protein n=1 Tax=Cardamine amara subsp. amara TaxID=228776 RepID=A0ABD1BLS5_CARAN